MKWKFCMHTFSPETVRIRLFPHLWELHNFPHFPIFFRPVFSCYCWAQRYWITDTLIQLLQVVHIGWIRPFAVLQFNLEYFWARSAKEANRKKTRQTYFSAKKWKKYAHYVSDYNRNREIHNEICNIFFSHNNKSWTSISFAIVEEFSGFRWFDIRFFFILIIVELLIEWFPFAILFVCCYCCCRCQWLANNIFRIQLENRGLRFIILISYFNWIWLSKIFNKKRLKWPSFDCSCIK